MNCPECSGRLIEDRERDELVCLSCGLVVSNRVIDNGPKWRVSKPSVGVELSLRLTPPPLSTTIAPRDFRSLKVGG